MARERREIQSQSSSGLLSGVLSFVSREIESFVTTATGGEVQNYDDRRRSSGSRGEDRERLKNRRDESEDNRGRRRSDSREDRRRRSQTRETSSSSRRARSRDRPHHQHNPCTPSPPQLHSSLRQRKQSVSMPGSLFPRSPSLLPDSPPRYADEGEDRRVRFETENEAGPSRPKDISRPGTSFEKNPSTPASTSSPPLDRRGVQSVKDAVSRFRVGEEDADSSILLPRVSPGKGKARGDDFIPVAVSRSPSRDKGKQRAREKDGYGYMDNTETCSEVRVRGKERELVEAREEQLRKERRREHDRDTDVEERGGGRDKERIRMLEEEIRRLKEELSKRPTNTVLPAPPPPPPPPPPGFRSTTRPRIISNPTLAQDALFASARTALKHTTQPVEAPINYGGLGARAKRTGQPTVNIAGEKMAAFLSEMKSVRLRKVGDPGSESAGPREESERNMGAGGNVNGLARRWSAGSRSAALDGIQPTARRSNPSSSLTRHGLPSFRSLGNRTDDNSIGGIGEKRKRGGESQNENAAKRRVVSSSLTSTFFEPSQRAPNSNTGPSSSSSASSSYLPPPPHLANRTWPSMATETDLTTPELCSDNENDADRGEGDSSLDDRYRLPSTPPMLGCQKTAQGKGKQQVDPDVDMDMDAPPRQKLLTASPRMRRESELFSKRPPTSPMLLDTPRKPRPPARPLGRATPKSTSSRSKGKSPGGEGGDDEDDDPLSLSFSSPDVVTLSSIRPKETIPASKKKQSAPSPEASREPEDPAPDPLSTSARNGSTNPSRRRLTLDEEMRDARASSLLREDEDMDSGILVGVGTRSKKKGYLAHGGAGGVPVFMSDGYVDGLERSEHENDGDEVGEDIDDDSDYSPKSKKSAGSGRRRGPAAAPAPVVKRKNRR